MNDQDRQLLADILHQAGTAGAKGFDYVVRLQLIDGITSIIGFAIAILGGLWCLKRLLAWGVHNDEDAPRTLGIGIVCVAMLVFLCGMFGGITQALAPEGAAILAVLHK